MQTSRGRRAARGLVASLALVAGCWAAPSSSAAPVTSVSPGMPVAQGNKLCTVGYVDTTYRIAFTAGHCRGDGVVGDAEGNLVGAMIMFRNNIPDGATIAATRAVNDYEAFRLASNAAASNVLPDGRVLVARDGGAVHQGQRVCAFGVTSGKSCGVVSGLNNGWFTMAGGILCAKGDSGGPVYLESMDGTAILVGMLYSAWGSAPAAVSWPAVVTQVSVDADAFTAAR